MPSFLTLNVVKFKTKYKGQERETFTGFFRVHFPPDSLFCICNINQKDLLDVLKVSTASPVQGFAHFLTFFFFLTSKMLPGFKEILLIPCSLCLSDYMFSDSIHYKIFLFPSTDGTMIRLDFSSIHTLLLGLINYHICIHHNSETCLISHIPSPLSL